MTERRDPRGAARRALLLSMRDEGVTRWVGLEGESMAPLIPPGASALVDFAARTPSVGSVVLADAAGRFVAHRVIAAPTARRRSRYVLKGDAELLPDPRVGPDEIYGTVRALRIADGPPSRAGLAGRRAHVIAVVSRLTSRALRAGLPMTGILPLAARRPYRRALAFVARIPAVLVVDGSSLRGADRNPVGKEVNPDAV